MTVRLDADPRVHRTSSPAPIAVVPDGATPHVSFVAVSYGTGPVVVASVASLVAVMSDTGIPYEYIVIDNAHPTAPGRSRRELALATRGVTIVDPQANLGFGGGCELGVLMSRGEVIAFVNPDIEFLPGFLTSLLRAIEEPDVSIAAPVLLDPDGSVQESGQTLFADASTAPVRTPPAPGTTARCTFASAACWVMHRREHERVGGFDPAFHPAYLEDVDFALRADALGGSCVVVADARVIHHRGASTFRWELPDLRPSQRRIMERYPELSWRQPAPQLHTGTF